MNKRFTFVSWKWGLFFLKKGNLIFPIKLGQRLPKSFSELHVKNSRLFLSYFLEKNDWPKAYTGPRLPTLPYPVKKPEKAFFVEPPNSGVFFHWDHFCEDHLSELFFPGTFYLGIFFPGDLFRRLFFQELFSGIRENIMTHVPQLREPIPQSPRASVTEK